ncbi:MAG: NFACT RNA binding domain-containing protein [Oligoflexales bacterium]
MISSYFRVGKCWQTQFNSVVWSLEPTSAFNGLPSKVFLELSFARSLPALSVEKPRDIKADGAFVNLFRKHVSRCLLHAVFRHEASGDVWIMFKNADKTIWYARLEQDKPPSISLLSPDGLVLVRMSSKGVYTKSKPYEGDVAYQNRNFRDITSQLAESLLGAGEEPKQPERDQEFERSPKQTEILRKLRRRLRTLKKSLAKSEETLEETSSIERLANWAQLLKSYSYLVDPKDLREEVTLRKDDTGLENDVAIALDSSLTVGENINEMFDKIKRMKKQAVMFVTQVDESKREISDLQTFVRKLETEAVADVELDQIAARKLGIKPRDQNRSHDRIKSKFRVFVAFDGTPLYVGKDAHNNDALTKGAKANDYWFHVVGIPGSHVVATMKRKSGKPSEKMLREGAILALHYSKMREDRAGEVYVTQKAHLRKKKGMAPGTWAVEKGETLYVKYTAEELKELLSRDNQLS